MTRRPALILLFVASCGVPEQQQIEMPKPAPELFVAALPPSPLH